MPRDAVHPTTVAQWRAWLRGNHERHDGVWFVSYKKHTGRPRVEYDDAVSEAVCWGWVDSLKRRLDDDRMMLRFTPRNAGTGWSASNKDRVARMMAAGRMRPAGLAKVDAAKADGSWDKFDHTP